MVRRTLERAQHGGEAVPPTWQILEGSLEEVLLGLGLRGP